MQGTKYIILILLLIIGIIAAVSIGLWGFLLLHKTGGKKYSDPREGSIVITLQDYPDPPPGHDWHIVPPGPVPIVNPLKGFVPYATIAEYAVFPYSMEFSYIPVNKVVICDDSTFHFDFTQIETFLTDVSSRGRHAIFRLYFDYPGLETGVPQCLIDAGVEMRRYTEFGGGLTPNYDDPRMVDLMVKLIKELGARYDGDPRIGFIEVGLLGHWGEWHTWPNTQWFANETTQRIVLETFDRSFNRTKILVRYPNSITRDYNVGFHDDSFAYYTLGEESWYFFNQIISAGTQDRWQAEPIGGEIRPEIQAEVFRNSKLYEHFLRCVEVTHASYLRIETIFKPQTSRPILTPEDLDRAATGSQRMGYTFAVCYVAAKPVSGDALNISVVVKNFGLAPFYYEWPVEFGIISADGKPIFAEKTRWSIAGILPNQTVIWSHVFYNVSQLCDEGYFFAIRVSNSIPNGSPVLFANEGQLPNGWLPLLECPQRGEHFQSNEKP